MKKCCILYYLKLRQTGMMKYWPKNGMVILSRPNFDEDCWFYWDTK